MPSSRPPQLPAARHGLSGSQLAGQRLVLALAVLALAALALAAPALARDPRGPGRPQLPAERVAAPAAEELQLPDLSAYRVLTVRDLAAASELPKEYQQELLSGLADRMAERLSAEAGLGLELRRGAPLGRSDELVLAGTLVKARRGNRAARYFVGPLARARLIVDLELSQGESGATLVEGRIKKLWAWPGVAGLTRGLPGLVEGACREVAAYLIEARPSAGPAARPDTRREALAALR